LQIAIQCSSNFPKILIGRLMLKIHSFVAQAFGPEKNCTQCLGYLTKGVCLVLWFFEA
jgi:hypothetical protein